MSVNSKHRNDLHIASVPTKRIRCKYMKRKRDYVICDLDGSIRKNGCPCKKYDESKLKKIIERIMGW